jgi:integrase
MWLSATLLFTGASVSELVGAHVEDFDADRGLGVLRRVTHKRQASCPGPADPAATGSTPA